MLATVQVLGSHFYQSYLIVNKDSSFHELEDLRGRVFAFADPESNTGKLVPTYWLAQAEKRPETFFSNTLYTYSHDNSILAVARGVVDEAAVDGLVWEYYHRQDTTFTSKTRVIRKSEPYGIPPLVAYRYASPELKDRIRQLVFDMHRDSEGKRILSEPLIDRFIKPRLESLLVPEAGVRKRALFLLFGYGAVTLGVFLLIGGLVKSPYITW